MSEDKPLPPPPPFPHHHFGPHPHPPLPYGGLPPRPWWGHPPSSEMLYHHLGNEGFRIVDTVYHYLGDIEYLIHLIESLGKKEEEEEPTPEPVTVDLPKKWQLTTDKYITVETQYTVTEDLDEFTTYRLVHDNYIKFIINLGDYLAVNLKLHPKIVVQDSKLYLVYPILPGFSNGFIEQATYQYTDPSVPLGVNKQDTLWIYDYAPQGLYSEITFDPDNNQSITDSGGTAVDFGELTFDYGYIPEEHVIAEGY